MILVTTVLKPILMCLVMCVFITDAMVSNPIVSRGKTAYTSSGEVSFLTDNKFNGQNWSVKKDSWIAINIGEGPKKVFLNLNNPAYAWAKAPLAPPNCPNNELQYLISYDIFTSSNSTNGSDGQWYKVLSIENNMVTARGHEIDFSGASWIKIIISDGGGYLDEVEVFDISSGSEDIWFFAGTSISANVFKGSPPEENFADLITKEYPTFNPVMIRGGIGCQNSTQLVQNLKTYLEVASNAHFWAIEHGTNDAWGGSNYGVETFKKNMQEVIDSCKKAGIEPVIARVIATNETAAGWQVHPDYLNCIDELIVQNNLIAGPDLYGWFLEHPEGLSSDGVHPNATGAEKIQQLWAQKMDSLYKATVHYRSGRLQPAKSQLFTAKIKNGHLQLQSKYPGGVSVFALNGYLIKRADLINSKTTLTVNTAGVLIVKFVHSRGMEALRFINE